MTRDGQTGGQLRAAALDGVDVELLGRPLRFGEIQRKADPGAEGACRAAPDCAIFSTAARARSCESGHSSFLILLPRPPHSSSSATHCRHRGHQSIGELNIGSTLSSQSSHLRAGCSMGQLRPGVLTGIKDYSRPRSTSSRCAASAAPASRLPTGMMSTRTAASDALVLFGVTSMAVAPAELAPALDRFAARPPGVLARGKHRVESADEAFKYLLAGADVVMTTSALLRHGVRHMRTLVDGLSTLLAACQIERLDEVRGRMSRERLPEPAGLERARYSRTLQG